MATRVRENGTPAEMGLSPPLLPDVGVIALVPDRWNEYWESRHHVLSRLARYFNVVWINPAVELHQIRFRHAFNNLGKKSQCSCAPGLMVYDPGIWLPKVYKNNFLARVPERLRLGHAYNILHRRGCHKTVLYLWRPEYASALDLIQHEVSCYHIDDEYSFSPVEQPLSEMETQLITRVDQVIIHSRALLEKKGHLNPNTAFVPNGVDYAAYARRSQIPRDLRAIPTPRLGYIGKIKKHVDYALLLLLAQRHREWSFVFVGPQVKLRECAPLVEQLEKMPNVYFLGHKPFDMLPAYMQHLDVAMLCYKSDGYTKYIYPLKLHEYLASGCPVVGAPLPTFREFSHVIKLADTPEEWSQVLTDALTSGNPQEQIDARRQVARQHDWNDLVRCITRSLCKQLGPAYLARFDEL